MLSMLVLGNSHLTALAQAYALRCQQNSAPPRLEFVRFNDPRFAGALHAEALAAVLQEKLLAGPYDLYVSMVGGNDHSVLGMLNHPRLFDFVLPEAPDLPMEPAAEIIPAGLLRAELQFGRVEDLLASGIHAFLTRFLERVNDLGQRISQDFLVPLS